MLLEYPDMFSNQAAIDRAFGTLDQGIERGQQLQTNQPQWNQGRKQIHAYTSEIDGAILPYGVTLPANYDPTKPTRLYVWLHGRQNTATEAEFIRNFLASKPSTNIADHGQIQLDCFGRINGAGWHWAGEMDVFESIAALKKRFNIDDQRIMLRGFSQGGEGAWHISLHYPDRFAAAEIGAGTVSRTAQHQPAGAPASRRIPQGTRRQRSKLARSHPLPDLHHALQSRLLGFPRRLDPPLRAGGSGSATCRRRRFLRHQNEEPHPPGPARDW